MGVLALLTNVAVEKKVLQRAFVKASTYGSDINDLPVVVDASTGGGSSGSGSESESGAADEQRERRSFKVEPQIIADIYRDLVIPLTKDVEIMYLFQRTGYPCPPLEGIHDEKK